MGRVENRRRSQKCVTTTVPLGKMQKNKPANKGAWQQWEADLDLPMTGYYEIWAKATDSEGDVTCGATAGTSKVTCLMVATVSQ